MITVPTNGCTVGISQMLTGTNRKTISVTTDIEATIFELPEQADGINRNCQSVFQHDERRIRTAHRLGYHAGNTLLNC